MTQFNNLLVNNSTLYALQLTLNNPGHALLVVGPYGYGKKAVSLAIAQSLLGLPEGTRVTSYPYFFHIKKESKSEISIDQIRGLASNLKLKVPGRAKVKKVILIENSELMSREAQNALLKNLEEPPEGTLMILTATSETQLLPTIASRTKKIVLKEVGLTESLDFFSGKFKPEDIETAWQLAGGAPALMNSLLDSSENSQLKNGVNSAKQMIALNRYELFLSLQAVDDKEQLYWLLKGFKKLLGALYQSRVSSGKDGSKLLTSRKLVNDLAASLEHNASPRLIKLKLVMNLSV